MGGTCDETAVRATPVPCTVPWSRERRARRAAGPVRQTGVRPGGVLSHGPPRKKKCGGKLLLSGFEHRLQRGDTRLGHLAVLRRRAAADADAANHLAVGHQWNAPFDRHRTR